MLGRIFLFFTKNNRLRTFVHRLIDLVVKKFTFSDRFLQDVHNLNSLLIEFL